MSNKIRSILEELDSVVPEKDKHLVLESRASHVITSAINILRMINENFSDEEADELSRRFILAIKNSNPRKFEQGIKKIKESHDNENRRNLS